MVEYEYVVRGDKIKEVVIVGKETRIVVPARSIPFSKRAEIEVHLNTLLEIGLELDKIRYEPLSEKEDTEERKIERFVRSLPLNARRLFLILNENWKPKSEIDKALGFKGGPELAGVLSGITKRAKQVGLIREGETGTGEGGRIIEMRWNGQELEYRLTELGVKIKQRLQAS